MTGLEPATSRPPAVRATNCATPRCLFAYLDSQLTTSNYSIATDIILYIIKYLCYNRIMSHHKNKNLELTVIDDNEHNQQLAQPANMAEQIRARMSEAPVFLDDNEQRLGTTAYRYGAWPATPDTDGRILTEEIVPDQEVLDMDGERDYFSEDAPSQALDRYMTTKVFTNIMESDLAPAIRVFDFVGREDALDDNGSTLLAASYPNAATFNERLAQTGNAGLTVEELAQEDYSNQRVVEMVAEGRLPVTDPTTMVMNAPVWALLPPEVHQALGEKARNCLESGGTDVNRVAGSIASMNLLIFGSKLINAASEDQPIDPGYSEIDKLGEQLNQLLRAPGGEDLEDHGRALAELTVAHIRKLDALNTV